MGNQLMGATITRATAGLLLTFVLAAHALAEEAEDTPLRVAGWNFAVAGLYDDVQAFSNREYVWKEIPAELRGWHFTQTAGGRRARIAVTGEAGTVVHIATAETQPGIDLSEWEQVEGLTFHYTDHGRSRMRVYRRLIPESRTLTIPQGNWSGALVLAPRMMPIIAKPEADRTGVPGVVIHHSPAASGVYVGGPGIAALDDGTYLAKGSEFGPQSTERRSPVTLVFRSTDRGRTWEQSARVEGLFWANIFVHRHAAYMIGTTGHDGEIVIVRSDDGGRTWTQPEDVDTGLLTEGGRHHTAPVPIVTHDGRIWRAVEDTSTGGRWPRQFRAMMMSAAEDADLLKRSSWTFSNAVSRNLDWLDGQFGGWLEGNAVVTRGGRMLNILRVHSPGGGKAAVVRVSADGRRALFDPNDFINFPGGAKKFTIRYDPVTDRYWSLSNYVPPRHAGRQRADLTRNTLALISSGDLRNWRVHCVLLYHPDPDKHAFQYVDWLFDGDDLIAVSRTAYADGLGGAHNAHDANFLTFHRFTEFRELTMADSVVDPETLGIQASDSP